MRILQLISSSGTSGAVMHAVRFSRLLAERGHEVVVAALPGGWAAQQLDGAVEVLPTTFERTPAEFARLTQFCRERGVQVTHSHLTRAHKFGWRLERRSGVPHVAHAHSHHWQAHWFRQRRVLAVSAAMVRVQRRWHLRRAEQVTLLYNYVDAVKYQPRLPEPALLAEKLGLPAGARAVACVAEIAARKGQLFLVRAWPAVGAAVPAAHLVLFGREGRDPRYAAKVRSEAQRLGVAGRVTWAGFRDDLAELLPQCAAAVLSSLEEPFALGGLEAMACGLPLVATRVGGMEEMVTPGTDGELIPPRDAVALAGALCRVLGDEAERRRRGAAARARVERDFTPAAHLAHFEAALRGWGIG